MNDTPSLFSDCPLRCGNLVDDPRRPCGECEVIFAGYIRPAAQSPTAEEAAAALTERDREVAAIYAERRTMTPLPGPAWTAPVAGPAPAPAAGDGSTEYKRNQLCWCCGERRNCRPDPDQRPGIRWICRTCEVIT